MVFVDYIFWQMLFSITKNRFAIGFDGKAVFCFFYFVGSS